VLKHHPDKKAGNAPSVSNSLYLAGVNQNTNDDAFFKCIQKAHEVLTNAEKRRQFDSVDPDFLEFEEGIPNASDFKVSVHQELFVAVYSFGFVKSKNLDFFKALRPVFDAYARFSKVQPVPGLGHSNATKQEVEGFYDFWYNFDSWRSFEWYDKEVNEGSDKYVHAYYLVISPDFLSFTVATTNDTPRRKISQSALEEKRKISPNYAVSLI
jgi:DnaJ family protein C protein 2